MLHRSSPPTSPNDGRTFARRRALRSTSVLTLGGGESAPSVSSCAVHAPTRQNHRAPTPDFTLPPLPGALKGRGQEEAGGNARRRCRGRWEGANPQLGSPLLVVNVADDTDVLLEAEYSAFGERTVLGGEATALSLGFAGGEHDSDSGLTRFGARDYDPSIGRWVSKDPALFSGGSASFYPYAGGDPVNVTDSNGREFSAAGAACTVVCASVSSRVVGALGVGAAGLACYLVCEGLTDPNPKNPCGSNRRGRGTCGSTEPPPPAPPPVDPGPVPGPNGPVPPPPLPPTPPPSPAPAPPRDPLGPPPPSPAEPPAPESDQGESTPGGGGCSSN
jgi:RHS repeat-associated protein